MSIEQLYKSGNEKPVARPASIFLKNLLSVFNAIGWAFLVGFIIITLLSVLALFGVGTARNAFEVTSPVIAFVSSIGMVIGALVFIIIVSQLRHICRTLLDGDPFVPQNAARLRKIWIAVAIGEILRQGFAFFISNLDKKADVSETAHEIEWSFDLRIYVWFMVLALIILSEVFKEGARLRQEEKFTV